jgi:putative heme-binding domain-containing protein
MRRMKTVSLAALLVSVLATAFAFIAHRTGPLVRAEEKKPDAAGNRSANGANQPPFGLQKRIPWTTSNFRGRPEPPPPFRPERFLPKIAFKSPTVLTSAPGTTRMFIAEHQGKLYSVPNDPNSSQPDLLLDVADLVDRLNKDAKQPVALEAVYGLTFDPGFAENRYCYVCYVVRHRDRSLGQLADGTRVSRLQVTNTDPPRCEAESEKLIISWLQGGHNGGCLKFGPDGCLYISTGDGGIAFPPDGLNSGQDVTNVLSTIMRIDVHHEQDGRPYTIPADNPFVSLPKARGEIWAYGLRNPWKMSFDRKSGDLWVGDVGWELWELVYRVHRGDNFGWSLVEGRQPVHTERQRGPTPIVPPTIEIPHTEGASVTGGFVYRGKKFPELDGAYIFGDWETRRIWGVTVKGNEIGQRRELVEPTVRIVDFAEDHDGELYLLDHDDGTIHTLVRNEVKPTQQQFPRKLTETGLFRSVPEHQVADGVLPFSINTEQWSDHATAERFLAVPGSDPIRLRAKPKIVPGSMFSRMMDFPRDTVVTKTLSLDLVHGDPSSRRRIETQVLHYDGRDWHGYTYEWNDEQTDASLVDRTGKNRTLRVIDPQAPGGHRTQNWWFASRMECVRCHNPWSEHTLAFNIPQLNRPHDYGSVSDNQIRTLRHIGLFEDVIEPIDPEDPLARLEPPKPPEELPHLSNPYDAALDVNDRARSYLHVNCGHCHRFNGGGSSYIYLQHQLPLRDVKAIGVRPTQGTFGIHDAQVIASGDPYRSVLYFRLAKAGPGHMPHLGSKIVDARGLALVHDWIRQLPVHLDDSAKLDQLIQLDESTVLAREHEEAPRTRWQLARAIAQKDKRHKPTEDDQKAAEVQATKQAAERVKQRADERRKLSEELLANPSRAMLVALAIRDQRLSTSIRDQVIETATNGADPAIRDLFEPFVPDERKVQRLGDSIQAETILKLAGDLERGRKLFHESTVVQCRNCHRIGEKGIELGPDLNTVGKKYDRVKLLENMLQPSLNVEPKYMTWLVETKSGSVHSGLLVKKDDSEIVLKDAQNKPRRIPANDIEGMFPQNKSIMPDAMFRDFTAQQVADLLAYLTSLK